MASHGGEPVLTAYSAPRARWRRSPATPATSSQPDRIRVNGLNIGWTATEGEHGVQTGTGGRRLARPRPTPRSPLGRLLRPDDIAPMVTYLLSDAARMVTGSVIDFDQTVHGSYGRTRRPRRIADMTRLTVAQALVRFLAAQQVERDGAPPRFFAGCLGIFGHGNVAGMGQALTRARRPAALRPGPQRAGDGPRRLRLRAPAQPPRHVGVHVLGRPGRDEHGHRRRAGHRQPAAGAAAARRHVRHARAAPGAPAARGAARRRTSRSTTASGRCRASSTASRGPSS